ncbi:hypothetical protein Dtox_4060 [Desulfofarcimen acetoxidans DSM 771]|uniref:SIR2-like domain-containing protein n=1 Tax=Desulfofarcimen acetoxidans (strain ATCC 49208 / DSM 771 / KCTC 5769 / VKM B-1644 / 5575) TaxID=485916 RepID=C8VYL6_DESAS|nr:hypothetical protein [Desulfofarcimen acetoxidans]ACV64737.1 hypothetical protein Dtox_4060 [Desulfofarcimen acetoxidans DSM 771]
MEQLNKIPAIFEMKENKGNIRRLINQMKSKLGVVPFVGAGLSIPFGYPGWYSFLSDISEQYGLEDKIEPLLYESKYENAAEEIMNNIGNRAFINAIEDAFGEHLLDDKDLTDTSVFLLPQLAMGPVITTNFDRVLENVFKKADCLEYFL